ncbi:MAG: HAMP domain-containing sensor histidine kinase, partial [Abditibacteriales bacterium]|nr:HAMP domain-containing sensor histidine kinase [Abditibacteriales bacterium]
MSHELRTPLNTILGMAEALQDQVYGPLTPEQMLSLRNIEESSRHLLTLINDLLDVSKIEAGKLELHLEELEVAAVCNSSLRLVRPAAEKKRLDVQLEIDPAVTHVRADMRRLKQILVNLLSNAVKFTPEGGALGLVVHAEPEREAVVFTVWDTGIGIAADDIPRLFQPFVQLDSRLARAHVGSGLGLTLVYRMTDLHGGGVSVVSAPGEGSRFSIALPWSPWSDPSAETTRLRRIEKALLFQPAL